ESSVIGMFMTSACVLQPATASCALLELLGSGPYWLRVCPRSNTPPRSTKNGSSRGPQNTCSPLDAVAIAACTSAWYVVFSPTGIVIERGPMLFGGTVPLLMIVVNVAPPLVLFSQIYVVLR